MCAESRLHDACGSTIGFNSRKLDKISVEDREASLRKGLFQIGCLAAGICLSTTVGAETLTAMVTEINGTPVSDAVIYAMPAAGSSRSTPQGTPAVMNQREQRFVPHVLVVQTGTAVAFPNNDTVSHHVYSFSAPKPFELPLYRGSEHEPIVFDTAGIVDLGCNIHDQMEAHVVVVDTPYYAKTSVDGRATLVDMPRGSYTLYVYTSRLSTKSLPEPTAITIADADVYLPVRLESRLRPPHQETSGSLSWSHY